MKNILLLTIPLFLLMISCDSPAGDSELSLIIPGFTAYIEEDAQGAFIDRKDGITKWTSTDAKIKWFFELKATGQLNLKLRVRSEGKARIKIQISDQEYIVNIPKESTFSEPIFVGKIKIKKPGYYSVSLQGIEKDGVEFCEIESLLLSGKATENSRFNPLPRRNSASVHLKFPLQDSVNAEWFYNEINVPEGFDPIHTYYEACGFHRGYFGIQVNSPTERRVIFSVWDSGNEAIDRDKVSQENRVTLLNHSDDVVAHGFGNEGTGGHSHWIYNWETGITYRFLIHAVPEGKTTTYTAFFFVPENEEWKLIASFKAPNDGEYFHGLYSFVENFWGTNGQLLRKAYFKNQWIRTSDGQWIELTKSIFSHDVTGNAERFDLGGGVENGNFYLFNGGFIPGNASMGDEFIRPETGLIPANKFVIENSK